MVEHDSIVPPGRTGKVVQQIKLSKLKSGEFTKAIKVISNAKNTDVLRLSLSGKILSLINISRRFLHLKPGKNGKITSTLDFSTEKANFTIKKVTFEEFEKSDSPLWQKKPPLTVNHTITRSKSADSDGYYTYTVTLSFDTPPQKRLSGSFNFDTNHPKKDILTVRGMIAPLEENK